MLIWSVSLESTKYLQIFLCFCKLFCSDFHLPSWLLALLSLTWEMGTFQVTREFVEMKTSVPHILEFAINYCRFSRRQMVNHFALVIHTVILTGVYSQPGPGSKGQLIVATRRHTLGGCFARTLAPGWVSNDSWVYFTGSLKIPLSLAQKKSPAHQVLIPEFSV